MPATSALCGIGTQGSGKTVCAELAALRVFNAYPNKKVVYIAPLKALVRERMSDWGKRIVGGLRKKVATTLPSSFFLWFRCDGFSDCGCCD